jgi:CRISPR/Cas system-associated exonuclease Cas4 (RecB family)
VIDAETARVMFTGSLREKAEHQDESSEGVELGEFSLKFKLAELPSDLEILAQLADAISLKIGQRLAEELKDPEVEYQKAAERHASEGNHVAASEQYAYAVALAERKGKPVDSLREKLRKLAVASSAGSH